MSDTSLKFGYLVMFSFPSALIFSTVTAFVTSFPKMNAWPELGRGACIALGGFLRAL